MEGEDIVVFTYFGAWVPTSFPAGFFTPPSQCTNAPHVLDGKLVQMLTTRVARA